jgi:multiple sugar transport system permease protein
MAVKTNSFLREVNKGRAGYFFILPGYIVFAAFMLLPLLSALALAFYDTDFVHFKWVGLGNFQTLLNDTTFRRAFMNTLSYVVVVVPVTIFLSLLIAFLVHPLGIKMQSFFRGAFYLPGVAGGIVLSVVWLWIFNPTYGLLNYLLGLAGIEPLLWLASSRLSLSAVSITVLTFTIGQPVVLFLAGLGNIPSEILDAALVDGANSWQRIRHVTLPLLRPVFLFVLATLTIGVFQIWETIYMLTQGGPSNSSTSIVFLIFQTAFLFSKYGLASAMGMVLMIMVVVVALIQLRFWSQSYLE